MILDERHRERYRRQLPVLGEQGQERLGEAHVLIAGAGGLGSPVAFYLASAGVGTLTIIDRDRVERSNLNRQILHWERDIGREKVTSAVEKVRELNPDIDVRGISIDINNRTLPPYLKGITLIIDATDNFPARYVLNRAAVEANLPLVFGAVYGLYGEVTTFLPGITGCLSCLCSEAPAPENIPVLGVTAGIIGLIQAAEAIRLLTGERSVLADRLLVWDGASSSSMFVNIQKNPECSVCSVRNMVKL